MSVSIVRSTSYYTSTNNLGIDGGACTMMAWVKINSAPTVGQRFTIVGQENANSDVGNILFYSNSAGTLKIEADRVKEGAAEQIASYNVDLGTTNYAHLAYVYDTTNVIAYLNGVNVGTQAASGTGTGGVDLFGIGTLSSGNNSSTINIGEVRVWNTALTDQGVMTEMRSLQPQLSLSNLLIYIPFDSTITPTNYGSVAASITTTGTPTIAQSPPF